MINVSWDDATKEYLPWLSKNTGKAYRLLTEAEWEYAARAGTETTYSWGDNVGSGNANCAGCGSQWDKKQAAPVGSFPANPIGLHDMHGNVWQWVQDCANDDYKSGPMNETARTTGDCNHRNLRGGSWNYNAAYLRSANRRTTNPNYRYGDIGFRVARDLTP